MVGRVEGATFLSAAARYHTGTQSSIESSQAIGEGDTERVAFTPTQLRAHTTAAYTTAKEHTCHAHLPGPLRLAAGQPAREVDAREGRVRGREQHGGIHQQELHLHAKQLRGAWC